MVDKSILRAAVTSILTALLVTVLCWLMLNTALPRQIGLAARYDLLIPLVVLLILNPLVLNLPGLVGQLVTPVYLMVVFSLPVSGLWASGTSEQYVLGGTIPYSDTLSYYTDALRFLEGGYVSSMSADKPFTTALYSGLLAVTHFNWLTTLVIIEVLVILAVYLAVRELQRTHGATAASIFLIILFLFERRFSGTGMTENLGLCFGLLAFVLFWRYTNPPPPGSPSSPGWLIGGFGVLALALFSRPGAFLILPVLFLWAVWETTRHNSAQIWRWQSWKTPILIVLVMLAVFGINRIIVFLSGGPNAGGTTQFTIHLYSLVSGGQYWGALVSDHPELANLVGNAYIIKALQICLSVFQQHPMGVLEGIARNYSTYFGDAMRGEYSYIDGASDGLNLVFRLGSFLLAGAGLGTLFLRRNRSIRWFVWLCFAGMFISIPFVPPISTYKLRLMAATLWIEALLPALAAAWLLSLMPKQLKKWTKSLPAVAQTSAWQAAIFALLLLALLVIAPLSIHLTAHGTTLPQLTCPAGQQRIVLRAEPGGYVDLVSQEDPRQGWLPYIRLAYFKIKIHNLAEASQYPVYESISQPTVLIRGIDLVSLKTYLVFVPEAMYSHKPGVVLACGSFQKDPPPYTDDFFYAQSLQELDIP